MRKKQKMSFFSVFSALIDAFFQRFTALFGQAASEAHQAIRALVAILILLFVLGTLLTSAWTALSSLLYLSFIKLHYSPFWAWAIVFVINLVALLIIVECIYKIKDKLFFPMTRIKLNVAREIIGNMKRNLKSKKRKTVKRK